MASLYHQASTTVRLRNICGAQVITQAQTYRPRTILIEETALGIALIQDFRMRHHPDVRQPIAVTPKGEKTVRLFTHASLIEAGQVWLPRQAPWLDAFKAELLAFPQSRHDDQVDSLSQFLTWIVERQRNCVTFGTIRGNF